MNNLILDIVPASRPPLQLQHMESQYQAPTKESIFSRIRRIIFSIIEFVIYAGIIIVTLIGVFIAAAVIMLHMSIYLWVFLDEQWPKQQGVQDGNQIKSQQNIEAVQSSSN